MLILSGGVGVGRDADRGEVPKGSAEIFFRKVKFWNEDEAEEAPPVFVSICSPLPVSRPLTRTEHSDKPS